MYRTLIVLVALMVTLKLVNAQSAAVKGVVTDADTHEKLPGVSVVIDDTAGTVTGADGDFNYTVNAGTHNIEFRYVGYEKQRFTIVLKTDDTRVLNIDLKNSSQQLGTVVVSASKFEQKLNEVVVSMDVIKPKDIENTNRFDMEEAVSNVPGVVVIDGQANIRGGSGFSYGAGSRVLVLVDDLPILAADANDVKWSFMPLESMHQLEVIKGASSALFGSSAMSGVINLRTAYPKDKPETKIWMFSGFYDQPKSKEMKWWPDYATQSFSGLNFNHSQKIKQFDLVLGGELFNDESFRKGEFENRARFNFNTRYRFKKLDGLSVGLNCNMQKSEGGLFILWQNDSTGALIPLGDLDSATTTISNYTTIRATVDPFITYFGKHNTTHKLRYRYFLTDNRNNTNQESTGKVHYTEYQFQKKFKNNITGTSGFVYQKNLVTSELYGDHHSDNLSIYAQADAKLGKWNLSLGARVERNTIDSLKDDFEPVFRMGANYAVAKATNLRASIGQGYRFPSIAEMFVRTNVGPVSIYPNDSLKPEYGWTAEVGIQQGFKIKNVTGYVDVAAFYQQYHEMMEFTFGVYGNPPGVGFKSINVGDIKIPGFEVALFAGGQNKSMHWSAMAGYTFIPVKVDSTQYDNDLTTVDSSALLYRYRNMFNGDGEIGYKKITLGLTCRYYSFMENINEAFLLLLPGVKSWRETHHDGDWIFDTRVRYDFDSRFSASFIVKNISNHEWTGRPADVQSMRQFLIQVMIKL